jgi:preprotein translocase subunit SecD
LLIYYRWAGANATLALILNGVLLLAALACFGAVLTLPGIAGVVLTIGMAVDSNVLIFERIREELRGGKTTAVALASGFSKAFATLVDTHVTTIVSCAFLFFFGTPAVQGFAATLVIGLITNLFTSVFVSRVAFDWELSRRSSPSKLNIGLAQ